jgi:hypothetical protein
MDRLTRGHEVLRRMLINIDKRIWEKYDKFEPTFEDMIRIIAQDEDRKFYLNNIKYAMEQLTEPIYREITALDRKITGLYKSMDALEQTVNHTAYMIGRVNDLADGLSRLERRIESKIPDL